MSDTQHEPEPVEEKTSFGEYDTDAPVDALPDYDAELTEETEEEID